MNSGPIRFFSTDLDHTLIGPDDSTRLFGRIWNSMPEASRPSLCFNTGRLLEDTLRVIRIHGLPAPDFVIAGVGTVIYQAAEKRVIKEFTEILEEGWSLQEVERVVREEVPEARLQPAYHQTPFKSSWYFDDAPADRIDALEARLADAGLEINVVYSSSRDLDVLPRWANKGNALKWLLKHLGVPPESVLVAGDSGNDSAMFQIKGVRGILVQNAHPELVEATRRTGIFDAGNGFADGVIEGLLHFGVLSRIPAAEEFYQVPAGDIEPPEDPEIRRLLDEDCPASFTPTQRDFIGTAFEKAIEGLRRNLTPLGFSACSLADNETRGTDENYRSVWARDGSIAVVGSLALGDPEFLDCSRATLETLLAHISPSGQVPANVRLEDGRPDYSGTGRIASIDSGIWVIIACYEFVRKTGDIAFLRRHREKLQQTMDWLTAHDSNNDSLLEIPEAGDWTDLFGRSYNVLYDEVLWYRANLCWGRLLEKLGATRQAGDYLRWSRVIRDTISSLFWPSTAHGEIRQVSFADSQYSVGDTNYLLAQITPFGFDWRCDVYGNILAYLCNVIDARRATTCFRFLWGAGASDPYPVANLYPAVEAGDPSWRSYYTVNLLNLPHHYHNGGIWPFIGAQWVRFIARLGMRDLALHELHRLAELNQKGVSHEWEFNEWAHGRTGKPMGKAFQAWSCSEFIATCCELGIGRRR